MRIVLVMLLAGLAVAQDRPNTLTAKESTSGWILLFDGKSLNGWEPHGEGDWKAEKGVLVCGGTTPSWIGTVASFSNYTLKLEFRGSEKVNSGVFLRSQKEGQPHRTGYELQIWDYQPGGFSTGSLVGSHKASPVKILAEQWNSYEITADGDHFVIVLNGKTLLDTRDSQHASGVVGFQCQKDNRIEFRNIKLRKK
jgi:3-keto-disaccharide hydrolase